MLFLKAIFKKFVISERTDAACASESKENFLKNPHDAARFMLACIKSGDDKTAMQVQLNVADYFPTYMISKEERAAFSEGKQIICDALEELWRTGHVSQQANRRLETLANTHAPASGQTPSTPGC